MFVENLRISIMAVAEDVILVFLSVLSYGNDTCSEFEKMSLRISFAQKLLNDVNKDPDLLKRIITDDEIWFDVELFECKWPEEAELKIALQFSSSE